MKRNKEANKYMATIRRLLGAAGIYDRRFYRDLRGQVDDYCEENTEAALMEIREEFGDEREIFQDYLESMEIETLSKKIRWTHWVKAVCVAVLCSLLIMTGIRSFMLYTTEKKFVENMIRYNEKYGDTSWEWEGD